MNSTSQHNRFGPAFLLLFAKQRVFASLVAAGGVLLSNFAMANPTLVGLDPLVVTHSANRWGQFAISDAIAAHEDGIELYVEPTDQTNFPGTMTGGLSVLIGDVELELDDYRLEIPIRVLGDNEAPRVIVTLSESGAPQTGEHYQFDLDLTSLEEDEWTTIVRPLSDYSRAATQGGDGVPENGFSILQLGSPFNSVETINIEVGGIFVRPSGSEPNPVAFRLDGNVFTGGYEFGTFTAPGAVNNQRDSIEINAQPGGGLGLRTSEAIFDSATHDIVIRARLGETNEASAFFLNLKDNDGVEAIDDVAAEEWLYQIETQNFNSADFTELRIPASYFSWRWPGHLNARDGNLSPDFGLYQLQVHNLATSDGRLELDLESIEIVDRGQPLMLGDFDGDNELGLNDIEKLVGIVNFGPASTLFDMNGDGEVNLDDPAFWVTDLKNTFFGDANLDGEFNSSDFVQVFTAGKYETEEVAGWRDGDWNFDTVVDSADFVAAFIEGSYEQGPRVASAVPEPKTTAAWFFAYGIVIYMLSVRGPITERRAATSK